MQADPPPHGSADPTVRMDGSMEESFANFEETTSLSGRPGAADQKPSLEFGRNSSANYVPAAATQRSSSLETPTDASKVSTFNTSYDFSGNEQSTATVYPTSAPSNLQEKEHTMSSVKSKQKSTVTVYATSAPSNLQDKEYTMSSVKRLAT